MRRIIPNLCVLFLLGGSACAVDYHETSPVDLQVNEHGEYALFGPVYFYVSGANACSSAQRSMILDAVRKGRQAAQTEEYATCIAHHLADDYRSCGDDDNDDSEDYAQHYWDLLRVTRSGNTNNLIIGCEDSDGTWDGHIAENGFLDYDHDRSQVFWLSNQFIDVTSPTRSHQADVASVIWHEVMHTHGYRHEGCGANYDKFEHSVPYIVQSCLYSAYHGNRAIGYDNDDTAVSGNYKTMGAGAYAGDSGELSPVGDNRLSLGVVGPGMRFETCTSSDGATGCKVWWNSGVDAVWAITETAFDAMLGRRVSFVDVRPVAVGYQHSQYRGAFQSFAVGTYRNSNDTLGFLPNDEMSSMTIPAGLDVTVCLHEGPGWKSDCARLGDSDTRDFGSQLPSRFNDNVSYIDVQPVAVLFSDNDFFGERQSFSWGRHLASDGDFWNVGNDNAESLILHDGMWVKVCYHEGHDGRGQQCRTYRNSTRTLGAYRNQVSYIEVGLDLNFNF